MRRIGSLILGVCIAAMLVAYHTHTAERDVVCLWKYSYEFVIRKDEKNSSAKTHSRNAPAARLRSGKK